ncbi:hypothetical protein [Phragmitibacter flavus]|nr:hypothetical protein [Phragmitibacter flavus]
MLGGSGSTTTIYGESSGEGIKAMEVAEAARIVGRLRRLNVSEREIIRRVAEERFNFLVALEREALRTKYEIRKAEVRRGALARVSKVQSGVRQGKMAASVARAEQQKIAREEQQLLGALEVDWMAEAREMAKRRYGSNFGIAVESEADKHVVAMADVYGDTLRVAISLYTVNRPVVVVDKVEKIQHNGRAIAVFSGPPVNLPSTP